MKIERHHFQIEHGWIILKILCNEVILPLISYLCSNDKD